MSCPDNPFKLPILNLLRQAESSLSEHQLITLLKEQSSLWPEMADEPQLALFQIHFLTMNALYQLQQELWPEKIFLQVSPLKIGLLTLSDHVSGDNSIDASEDSLRNYYLDWNNYAGADSEQVQSLLDSFWTKYMNIDQKSDACFVLKVEPDSSWQEVQKSYRRMAAQHHPDRGGDARKFLQVREAYELLSVCYVR